MDSGAADLPVEESNTHTALDDNCEHHCCHTSTATTADIDAGSSDACGIASFLSGLGESGGRSAKLGGRIQYNRL